MHELLAAIKDKYRIFLVVRVDQGEGSDQHLRAKASVQKLIDEGIIQHHRAMYCTTQVG